MQCKQPSQIWQLEVFAPGISKVRSISNCKRRRKESNSGKMGRELAACRWITVPLPLLGAQTTQTHAGRLSTCQAVGSFLSFCILNFCISSFIIQYPSPLIMLWLEIHMTVFLTADSKNQTTSVPHNPYQ